MAPLAKENVNFGEPAAKKISGQNTLNGLDNSLSMPKTNTSFPKAQKIFSVEKMKSKMLKRKWKCA